MAIAQGARRARRVVNTAAPRQKEPRSAQASAFPVVQLSVLGGFTLRVDGATQSLPNNVERVLAFLAVRGRPQLRTTVATTLWMDTTDDRAAANLRTALWRARQTPGELIAVTGNYVALAPSIDVDLATVTAQSKRLISTDDELREADAAAETLVGDLLPDWDEDWIAFERERLRQLQVHALEALSRRLSGCRRHGEAIDAGQAAVAAEPLRESAQRSLIEAHLVEGNLCEGRRQYEMYRALLWENLGVQPSEALRELVGLPSWPLTRAKTPD
jgi:DNA-binding SARP family transcriptional activator